MSNLVHNERAKLMATFFNNLGVVAFATGAILPIFQSQADNLPWLGLIIGVPAGLFFAFAGQSILKQLKE